MSGRTGFTGLVDVRTWPIATGHRGVDAEEIGQARRRARLGGFEVRLVGLRAGSPETLDLWH